MSLVVIAGRLGKDASVETTSGGTKMVKFSVVENEYRNGEDTTTWYDVTSFNPFIIEKQVKALKKGSFIVAPADLNVRPSFGKNGQLFLNYDAIVSSIKIININSGKHKENTETTEEEDITTGTIKSEILEEVKNNKTTSKPKETKTVEQEEKMPTVNEDVEDDELPF